MVIDQDLAERFIEQYRDFLLYIHDREIGQDTQSGMLKKLSLARSCYVEAKETYDQYIDNSDRYDPEVKSAFKSLDVADWVYIRDTEHFSLFVKSNGSVGLAVVGLTQPINDIFGCSGIYMKAGIIQLGGKYVIDGIISDPVKLGEGHKNEFAYTYNKLKENGAFFRTPLEVDKKVPSRLIPHPY